MDLGLESFYSIGFNLSKGKGFTQTGKFEAIPSRIVPVGANYYLLEAAYQHSVPYIEMMDAEGKKMIFSEVLVPLSRHITVNGLLPIDFKILFPQESGTGF